VRAPVQNYRWSVAGSTNFTAEFARFTEAAKLFSRSPKQDQCWILAQKIFVAGKTFDWNLIAKSLFRTATQRLSSTARVNVAGAVQKELPGNSGAAK